MIVVYCTENSRPTLKELYEKFTPSYAAHWKRIGVFLDVPNGVLDAIESEFFGDCQECCDRMVAKWLDVDVMASWKKLQNAVNLTVLKPLNRKSMQLCMF